MLLRGQESLHQRDGAKVIHQITFGKVITKALVRMGACRLEFIISRVTCTLHLLHFIQSMNGRHGIVQTWLARDLLESLHSRLKAMRSFFVVPCLSGCLPTAANGGQNVQCWDLLFVGREICLQNGRRFDTSGM